MLMTSPRHGASTQYQLGATKFDPDEVEEVMFDFFYLMHYTCIIITAASILVALE
jgi:hypothetical protein